MFNHVKKMCDSKDEMEETSALVKQIAESIKDQYYLKFCDLLNELNLYDDGKDGPITLETWMGIAQAIADASGYTVTLQAALTEPLPNDASTGRITGLRDVAVAEPMLFIKTVSLRPQDLA
jgi:hypothetical protein